MPARVANIAPCIINTNKIDIVFNNSPLENLVINISFSLLRSSIYVVTVKPLNVLVFAEELNLHNDSSERERKKVVASKQVRFSLVNASFSYMYV